MSGLATGIVKNTTGTGVPSIAVAGTDYQAPLTLPLTGDNGGTGVANTGKTLTLGGSYTINGTTGSTLNIATGGTLGTNAFLSTAFAPLASPTFTGTVTIPTPFTLGAISVTATGTELNYSVGVTSAIQTQFTGKASTTLNNLGTTSINADLLPASTQNLGSATLPWLSTFTGNTTQYESVSQGAGLITHTAAGSATNIGTVYALKGTGTFAITGAQVRTLVLGNGTASITGGTAAANTLTFNTGNLDALYINGTDWRLIRDLAFGWTSDNASAAGGGRDTSFSRISAGLIGVGSGAAGSFAGSLKLTDLTAVGTLSSADPTSGQGPVWKLGARKAATVVFDTTQYVEVNIGGTTYKLGIVN